MHMNTGNKKLKTGGKFHTPVPYPVLSHGDGEGKVYGPEVDKMQSSAELLNQILIYHPNILNYLCLK